MPIHTSVLIAYVKIISQSHLYIVFVNIFPYGKFDFKFIWLQKFTISKILKIWKRISE